MKRFIAIVLLMLLISIPFMGIADALSEQLAKYSVEDLYKLYSAVEKELVSRGGTEEMKKIVAGRYVAGTNLPAGTYELTLFKGLFGFGTAYVCASMDDYKADNRLDYYETMGTGSKILITLEENYVLVIDTASEFFIKKVEPAIFTF